MEGALLEERSSTVGKEPFLQSHVSVRRKQPVSARRRRTVARIIEDEVEGQWCVQKPVKYLRWSILQKYLMAKRRLTIFIKCSSSDVQQGSEYDSEGSLKIEFLVCLLHFFFYLQCR